MLPAREIRNSSVRMGKGALAPCKAMTSGFGDIVFSRAFAAVRELPLARVGKGAALFQIRMNRTPRLVSLIRLGAAKPHTLV